jgi:molybdenum cofactor biosynthesis protein B
MRAPPRDRRHRGAPHAAGCAHGRHAPHDPRRACLRCEAAITMLRPHARTTPMPIDETLPFVPVNIAVLTVSDTRDLSTDRSGQTLADRIAAAGHHCTAREIIRDEADLIEAQLRRWIADPTVDCVITTGGTGITGRDVTPEAFKRVLEKEIEGFGELFRMLSYQKIGTSTIQSRALGGVAHGTYLFALPGSTGACKDAWDDILLWQLDSRHRPCNLVELMPRLKEHLRAA